MSITTLIVGRQYWEPHLPCAISLAVLAFFTSMQPAYAKENLLSISPVSTQLEHELRVVAFVEANKALNSKKLQVTPLRFVSLSEKNTSNDHGQSTNHQKPGQAIDDTLSALRFKPLEPVEHLAMNDALRHHHFKQHVAVRDRPLTVADASLQFIPIAHDDIPINILAAKLDANDEPERNDSFNHPLRKSASNIVMREPDGIIIEETASSLVTVASNDTESGNKANAASLGGWLEQHGLTVSFNNSITFDDNYFSTETDPSSYIFNISKASASLKGNNEVLKFEIGLDSEIGLSKTNTADNYFDHTFDSKLTAKIAENLKLTATATVEFGHDSRGSNDDVADSSTPHLFVKPELELVLASGDDDSILAIDLAAIHNKLIYRNHAETTDNLELEVSSLISDFTLSRGPESSVLATVEFQYNNYQSLNEKNSIDTGYLLGMDWSPSDMFNFSGKVGLREKYFTRSDSTPTFRSLAWDLSVEWKPLEYSVFTVSSSMSTSDSTGSADLYSTSDVDLSWAHEWNEAISTTLETNYSNKNSEGIDQARLDKKWTQGISVDYTINEDVALKFGYDHTTLDSNTVNSSYKQNLVTLSLDAKI